jgi:hypothetical protein
MKKYRASNAMRFFMLLIAALIGLGIWQTGFAVAHWLLYLPATIFAFAAITGICPSLLIAKRLFGENLTA